MYKKIDAKNQVLKVLFENPTYRYHIRELASVSRLNPNTIINVAILLEKENLIQIIKKKHVTEIYANLESKEFIRKKRLFNIAQLYDSGLVDFIDSKYFPKVISVIGSYSSGEDIEKSDIDLIVINNTDKKIIDSQFEKKLSRNIHLILTDYRNISEEFYASLINGVILSGFLDKR